MASKNKKVKLVEINLFSLQKTLTEPISRSFERAPNAFKLFLLNEQDAVFKRIADRIRRIVRQSIKQNITGEPAVEYAPLSRRYERWKKKHYPNEPILKLTGRSLRSFKIFMDVSRKEDKQGRGVVVLSFKAKRMPYYMEYHTTGTSIMPKRDWRTLHKWVREKIRGVLSKVG